MIPSADLTPQENPYSESKFWYRADFMVNLCGVLKCYMKRRSEGTGQPGRARDAYLLCHGSNLDLSFSVLHAAQNDCQSQHERLLNPNHPSCQILAGTLGRSGPEHFTQLWDGCDRANVIPLLGICVHVERRQSPLLPPLAQHRRSLRPYGSPDRKHRRDLG